MTGVVRYIPPFFIHNRLVLDMRDCFTCSFTEFFPFCIKLYYFSNFKDFNKITGRPFSARVAHVWKLKDGKIQSFEQFVDSEMVNIAMK